MEEQKELDLKKQKRKENLKNLCWYLFGFGLGAGAVYLWYKVDAHYSRILVKSVVDKGIIRFFDLDGKEITLEAACALIGSLK